jgi:hypothetical protein
MMKKILLLFLLSLAGLCAKAETTPQWVSDLLEKNEGLIDSIRFYPKDPKAPHLTTYVIYYNQPMNHAMVGSPHFHLRALLTVDNTVDAVNAVNHVYCSGYGIDSESFERPDSSFAHSIDCANEIAHRYKANYLQIEHRYFQYSAPDKCWEQLDDCRAEEAAQDFHALFDAMKKVFKGKWVMSGVSKGGITTLLQHTFFPNDMDIFVPYAAPFFDTERDRNMQKYWYENGWSKEFLDVFSNIRKSCLKDYEKIFTIYLKMNLGPNDTQERRDSLFGEYLTNVGLLGFDEHCYKDTTFIRKQMHINDSIMGMKHLEYGDTVYAFMMDRGTYSLDSISNWIDTLRAYPDTKNARIMRKPVNKRYFRPFGIKKEEWFKHDSIEGNAYAYQSKCELGYCDLRFDLMCDDPDEGEQWDNTWQLKYGCLRDKISPFFKKLTFSRALYDKTVETTKNATKPIMFVYGLDDAWTGAAMKDEFINSSNVRKYILPAQNHMVNFTAKTDPEKCDQMLQFLDQVLGSPATGISISAVDKEQDTGYSKVIENGQIYILRNGRKYTMSGIEVK